MHQVSSSTQLNSSPQALHSDDGLDSYDPLGAVSVESLQKELDQTKAKLSKLESSLQQKEDLISSQKRSLHRNDGQISSLQNSVDAKKREIETLSRQMRSRSNSGTGMVIITGFFFHTGD